MLELSLLYNNIQSNKILCINSKMVLWVIVSPENNSNLKLWLCMYEYSKYVYVHLHVCVHSCGGQRAVLGVAVAINVGGGNYMWSVETRKQCRHCSLGAVHLTS